MTTTWHEIEEITPNCDPRPEADQILLPKGAPMPGSRRLLVEGGGSSKLFKPGIRTDNATGACVSGADLLALGGDGAKIRYREISFFGILRRDRWLALALLIAVLTLAGALLAAYGTFVKSNAEAADSFANQSAVAVFAIATVLAFAKFINDYHEL